MTVVIDREKALELLRAQVEKKGADYVYHNPEPAVGYFSQCVNYLRDGTPSCIVGYALTDLGLDLPDIIGPSASAYETIEVIEEMTDIKFTPEAAWILAEAQGKQDQLVPWGEAVNHAAAADYNSEEN